MFTEKEDREQVSPLGSSSRVRKTDRTFFSVVLRKDQHQHSGSTQHDLAAPAPPHAGLPREHEKQKGMQKVINAHSSECQ